MHEPKEQSYLIMDTIVKTCRYRHVFTALTSTFIKVLPVDGRIVINLCLGIYIAQAEYEEFSVVDTV